MAIGYGRLGAAVSRFNDVQTQARPSGRMADFVETLSLVVVFGALAGLALIVVALLMTWLSASHGPELLQHVAQARGFR